MQESILKRHTDEELKQLAKDILSNLVFTDRHINPHEDRQILSSIFMGIALGAFSNVGEEDKNNIGMIYEYMSEAGPRSINGYPCFMSLKVLHKDDAEKVSEYYTQMTEALEGI